MAKKVLIVEDEEVLLNLLQKKLTEGGYEISVARDGEKALTEMRERKPDLILLDIIMPKMGGFEVMKKMAKDEKLKDIPVIIISNSGELVELEQIKKLGAKDWLIKTEFDPREITDKVQKQIGK